MEKVKITQAQADAIEAFRKTFIENKATSMSNKTLIRALNHGYEVEPEFKVGDWVASKLSGEIRQITEIKSKEITPKRIVSDAIIDYPESLRHATPSEIAEEKERRWWRRHGREPWELREDDLLEYLGDLYIVDCFDSEKVCLKSGINRKSNYEEPFDYVKKYFKIVCLAENRLDVKINE